MITLLICSVTMRVKGTLVCAAITVIIIVVLRNFVQSGKRHASIVNVTESNEFKRAVYAAVQYLHDDIQIICKKSENEEKIIRTTIATLRLLSESIARQVQLLKTEIYDACGDLETEVDVLMKQLNEIYTNYDKKLNEIPIIQARYENIYEHMSIIKNNNRKQMNETRHEIRSKLDKWRSIKQDLERITSELTNMENDFNPARVESMVSEIYNMVDNVKEKSNASINLIIGDMVSTEYNITDDQQIEDTVKLMVVINRKKLREILYEVEKLMLQIDLYIQQIIDINRTNCFEVIKSNRQNYLRIKRRVIEFIQDGETSINNKNDLVEDVTRQIDQLSRLRVTVLTDEGETFLKYNESVPFFGILPNETLASYISVGKKSSMTNYGVRSDGSQFIREITKEQIDDEVHVKETFFDEEGLVDSEKSYIFNYDR